MKMKPRPDGRGFFFEGLKNALHFINILILFR